MTKAIPVVYSLILPKHLTLSIIRFSLQNFSIMVFMALLKTGLFPISVTDNKLLLLTMQHPLNAM